MIPMLDVRGLTGGYNDTDVIFDISARVFKGQVLGVFGRNGVGKSTFAKLLQGGLTQTRGDIEFEGVSIGALKPHQRRALGIGYMPQTAMVFDDLTVWENLTLGKNSQSPEAYFDHFPRLAERRDQPAGTMSGGERKILAFVRCMVEDTSAIILDEPSEGVQPENIERLALCLGERVENGATVILCEQNIKFLTRVSDHYLGIDAGRVVMDADAKDISEEQVRSILTL